MQGGKSRGSASISAVVVFMSALLVLGMLATLYPNVASFFSAARAGLQEGAERASELIRIYIHTLDETEYEPPIITIINGHDRESILTDYVVVARDGRVLAAGKMGNSLEGIRLPPGGGIDLRPQDFGLSYATFASMADEVKAIYIRTAEGNSFGSSYGPPPKINPDYQLSIRQNSMHILVVGTTITQYNFTIMGNFTIPTVGYTKIVKNVILVDSNGVVRGGATAGNKWSDGSFHHNRIPDSVAAFTRDVDVAPIGGYYVIPGFPRARELYSGNCWRWYGYNMIYYIDIYNECDTGPAYIELIEFYPAEYYESGSPVTAAAYWLRYGGPTEVVYNQDLGRVVTITRQLPVRLKYPAKVVDYSVETTTIIYGTTLSQTVTTHIGNKIIITTTLTTSYVSTVSETITYTRTFVDSGNMLIYNPIFVKIAEATVTPVTATATFPINLRGQVEQAVLNKTLTGDMYLHQRGAVQGGQVIKIRTPIILLNYVYRIGGTPPPPPQPSSGGGGSVGDVRMVCEVTGGTSVSSGSGSSSSGGSSGSGSGGTTGSSGSSREQPAVSLDGRSPVPDYWVREQEVEEIKSGVCRPVPA